MSASPDSKPTSSSCRHAPAVHYADLVAERERQGRPVSTADGQIAASCRCHGAHLATRNVRDFDATGITVLDPWAAVR